jgi:hypothetical protein
MTVTEAVVQQLSTGPTDPHSAFLGRGRDGEQVTSPLSW